jgi:hypothetical protein
MNSTTQHLLFKSKSSRLEWQRPSTPGFENPGGHPTTVAYLLFTPIRGSNPGYDTIKTMGYSSTVFEKKHLLFKFKLQKIFDEQELALIICTWLSWSFSLGNRVFWIASHLLILLKDCIAIHRYSRAASSKAFFWTSSNSSSTVTILFNFCWLRDRHDEPNWLSTNLAQPKPGQAKTWVCQNLACQNPDNFLL